VLGLDELLALVHALALAEAFLLVALLHLHELLEGGFGVEVVGFGADAGTFLAGLHDLEFGVGFVGRQHAFR
jgi:hypothetical protein